MNIMLQQITQTRSDDTVPLNSSSPRQEDDYTEEENTKHEANKHVDGNNESVISNDAAHGSKDNNDLERQRLHDEEEEEEEILLTMSQCIFWLGIITVLIAILSDAVVGTIEEATSKYHVSKVFVATIIIPIVGNAAEHYSAITFCLKNKLEISIGIAVGSSCQISVFVIPLLVLISWMGGLELTMDFKAFETAALVLTAVLAIFSMQSGYTTWLTGLMLVSAYLIIAIGFGVHQDENM